MKKKQDKIEYKNKYERIIHSKWKVFFLLVVFIFLYLFVGSYMALAMGSVLASFVMDVLMLCFAYWYLHTGQNKFVTTWGRKSKLSLTKFAVIISLSAPVIYFVCQLAGEAASLNFGDPNMKLNAEAMRANPGLTVIMSMIFAPMAEEMVFRGMIYNTLKVAYNPIAAMILQALVFSAMHGTWAQGVGTFLLAIFNCLIYEYSGRIRYAIYCHMGYNVFAVFFAIIRWPRAVFNLVWMAPIYVLAVATAIYMFIRVLKLKKRTPKPNDPLKQILGIK